jgi:hypothetical protein
MLKAEFKETVDAMTQQDLAYLESYLKVKHLVRDSRFRETMESTLKDMKNGNALTSKDMRELSDFMQNKGI